MQPRTISQLCCDPRWNMDFIQQWQSATTSSVIGPRRSSKALPKPKLALKKKVMSLFGVWSTVGFWIPVKPLHLRSMLSKSMRCTENCISSSWHWSTEKTQFFSTTPDHMSHNQRFKSWMNWATKFCLIRHIHLTSRKPTTTSSRTWRLFAGKCFHNQQEAENAFQEFVQSLSMDFYTTGINKLISHWQKCVDFSGSYLD